MGSRGLGPLAGLLILGCGGPTAAFRVTDGSDVRTFATSRSGGTPSDPESTRFRTQTCDGVDLRPDGRLLTEEDLVQYLSRQQLDVRVERPRVDLIYLTVSGAGTNAPVRLRVAVLKTPDEAGKELYQAILQHGTGSWGVHRSNLAVLGPIGTFTDDLKFASKTKLSCWGMFITGWGKDAYAVPGGYREL